MRSVGDSIVLKTQYSYVYASATRLAFLHQCHGTKTSEEMTFSSRRNNNVWNSVVSDPNTAVAMLQGRVLSGVRW